MQTVRKSVFETNSSSCHVLTIVDENELERLKSGECKLYVPRYSSDDDDGPYDSELVDKARAIEILKDKIDEAVYKEHEGQISDLLDKFFGGNINPYDIAQYSDLPYQVEDFVCQCTHEESDPMAGAKVKEINGGRVYVSCWIKLC